MADWGNRRERLTLWIGSYQGTKPPVGRRPSTHLLGNILIGLGGAVVAFLLSLVASLPVAIALDLNDTGIRVDLLVFLLISVICVWRWNGKAEASFRRLQGVRTGEKVDQLRAALAEAAQLSEELSAELAARMATLERIRAEAESWERLAAVRQTEAEAVARLVRAEVDQGVQHLDRMGLVFAASGWIAAVLVVVFEPVLPVLHR